MTESHVDKAYWNGDVASSLAGAIICAIVPATNLRTTSPQTIPRTPPPGFCKTVSQPMRKNSNTSEGNLCPGQIWANLAEEGCVVFRFKDDRK